MAFKDFPEQQQGISLLQRSLQRGRLGHAYLFIGDQLQVLEDLARTLAKTLNCQGPVAGPGARVDCCDSCLSCRKIDHANHPDAHWVRPESKMRIITVLQVREMIRELQLKPAEAKWKVGVIVAADRLKTEAANAFLKTLEEPPQHSVLMLLTTEPQRLLETIVSRCLRLTFGSGGRTRLSPEDAQWLGSLAELAARDHKSLLARYRLMDFLLQRLTAAKGRIEGELAQRSPLEEYSDADKNLVEKWESELSAAVEAEYRRVRAELLSLVQFWLRDIWLQTLPGTAGPGLMNYPEVPGTKLIAARISPAQAGENLEVFEQLQQRLATNVQEALALEVGLLKLNL